jgi:hypothetical protein
MQLFTALISTVTSKKDFSRLINYENIAYFSVSRRETDISQRETHIPKRETEISRRKIEKLVPLFLLLQSIYRIFVGCFRLIPYLQALLYEYNGDILE